MIGPLRVFIGYDSKEPVAYHVLSHSILRRASGPVSIQPVALTQLSAIYIRQRGPTESTEFSLTRFLVPSLSGHEGYSVFLDCDILCLTDLTYLWDVILAQRSKAVLVCQHDYTPAQGTKFLGHAQTVYPRKNWSSVVVFNNALCAALTREYVHRASGLDLHRFHWLPNEAIGSLPLAWNYLVGESGQSSEPPNLVHFTNGGPWFRGYEDVEYAEAWRDERAHMLGLACDSSALSEGRESAHETTDLVRWDCPGPEPMPPVLA
jgi:hypothetical protein